MSETKSYQNNQALVEWSKWISGISLFSASGCVGVLVSKGVGEKNIINIKLAIVFFLISVVVAWLIQLAIAMQDQSSSIQEGRKPSSQALLKSLIALEILMFLLSCFYLARWVWKFPAAKPAQEIVSVGPSNPDSSKSASMKSASGRLDLPNSGSSKPDLGKSNLLKSDAGRRDAGKQQSARRKAARLIVPKSDSASDNSVRYDTGRLY